MTNVAAVMHACMLIVDKNTTRSLRNRVKFSVDFYTVLRLFVLIYQCLSPKQWELLLIFFSLYHNFEMCGISLTKKYSRITGYQEPQHMSLAF